MRFGLLLKASLPAQADDIKINDMVSYLVLILILCCFVKLLLILFYIYRFCSVRSM